MSDEQGGAPTLRTERLLLRGWRDADLAPFAALNADPRVAEHLRGELSRAQSDALVERFRDFFLAHGFGPWAVELVDEAAFIGFVGLWIPEFDAHFTPTVEAAWRISPAYWSRGLATEAARAALSFGFEELGRNEIVAFTTPSNRASRRVMEKLGMAHDPRDDFDHPLLPIGHALRPHVLYRIRAPHARE